MAFVSINWSEVRKTGDHSDAQLNLNDGTSIKIHKILLATGSPYFEKLFKINEGWKEYKIKEVTSDTMNQILNWMYSHKMELTDENVPDILKTAFYLDCFEVVAQCTEYLMRVLTTENVIRFWNYAKKYQMTDLEEKFMCYLTYHFASFIKEEEFTELTSENLAIILKRDDLNADEQTIFHSLMKWIYQGKPQSKVHHPQKDKSQRLVHLPELLPHIRLGCVTRDFMDDHVWINSDILDAWSKMDTFLTSVDNWHGGMDWHGQLRHRYANFDNELCNRKPTFAIPRKTEDIILAIEGFAKVEGIETYDYWADKWTIRELHSLHGLQESFGAAVIGRKLYVVGGTECGKSGSVIDLESGESKMIAPMHTARKKWFGGWGGCLVSVDGYLYAAGGYSRTVDQSLNSMERYDPQDNQWKIMPRMKTKRESAGYAVIGQKICIVGGYDGQHPLRKVEVYDCKTDKWITLPEMSTKRMDPSCAGLEGELYVLGGDDGNHLLSSCEKYNFQTKTWTKICNMITPRRQFCSCIFDGNILVFGGWSSEDYNGDSAEVPDYTDKVEVYQKSQNCWEQRKSHEGKFACLAAYVVPGQGFLKRQIDKNEDSGRRQEYMDI